jgi:hypothetical protein
VTQERKSLFSSSEAGGGKGKLKCEQFNKLDSLKLKFKLE